MTAQKVLKGINRFIIEGFPLSERVFLRERQGFMKRSA
jgi:hypothetical protein